jgi:glycosyltransferase involved in cell wall biosynthesis
LIQRSLSNVDLLLAPSEFTARQHRAAGLATPIEVLPTFSSLEPGFPVRCVRRERPGFVFVGRITASKGIGVLLEEFARLPAFDLDVIGDGELRHRFEEQYAGHRHIRFLGSVPQRELIGAYQNATALILPSLAPEVFPLTVLEALACGTPAVVHDAGGNREAVEKTGGGVVYRSGKELRQILSALAQDATLREALAQRARTGKRSKKLVVGSCIDPETNSGRFSPRSRRTLPYERHSRSGLDPGTSDSTREHNIWCTISA